MKRANIILLVFICFICHPMSGQVQNGMIRTNHRSGNPSMALGDVILQLKGDHNTYKSKHNGTFSLPMNGKKEGEGYIFHRVRKTGYKLLDESVEGRPYPFSSTVPLQIVMFDVKKQREERERLEDLYYRDADAKYQKKLSGIEAEIKKNASEKEELQIKRKELQDWYEKYQSMIGFVVENLVQIDYDMFDQREQQILKYMESGEFEQAESLIKEIGYLKQVERIQQNYMTGLILQQQIKEDYQAWTRQLEKDAELLMIEADINLAQFRNDSAKYFIELRAELNLDSTHISWMLDAGDFMLMYFSDYKKANEYYEKSLAQSVSRYGENHPLTAKCYQKLVGLYYMTGDYENADKYYKLADKALNGYEDDNIDLFADSFILLGTLCSTRRVWDSAIECFETALSIMQEYYGERSSEVATCWGHLGAAYYSVGNINKSLECYLKCAHIREDIPRERKDNIYRSYNHLALVFASKGEYQRALTYCKKALAGMLQTYGKIHREIATCYRNYMNVYLANYDYNSALSYAQKGLDIMTQLVGNDNLYLAVFYDDISNIYNKTSHFDDALEYAAKALEIRKKSLGESHPDVASSYHLLAGISNSVKDYAKSRLFLETALSIYQNNGNNNLVGIAAVCNDLGTVCGYQHDFANANKYFQKAISIKKEMYGDHHIEMAITYGNIALMFEQKGDDKKAMEYWKKSIDIRINTFGEHSDNVANTYMYVGTMSYKNRKFKRALVYFEKALEIYRKIHGEDHQSTKTAYANVNASKRML